MSRSESPRWQLVVHFMRRLYGLRQNDRLLLSLPLLIFVFWVGASERTQYQHARHEAQESAERAGAAYARIIENRLSNQFRTMDFASTLLDTQTPAQPLNAVGQALFKRLSHQHPEFYALSIYAADGSTRIWSNTLAPSFQPITPAKQFTPLANPNELFGQDNAPRMGEPKVLSLRYRVQNTEGVTVFYLSTPFSLSALLYYPASNLPWQFTVIDTRDHSILGTWAQQKLVIANQAEHLSTRQPAGMLAVNQTIPNTPLEMCTAISEQAINQMYWQGARARLGLYAGLFLLLMLSAWGLSHLMQERKRSAKQLLRLAQFNALLAEVNQVIDRSSTESELLHTLCDLAVAQGALQLAMIARPDEQGWFVPLAASGPAIGYTVGLKLSIQADSPYGQGTGGMVWRSGEAFYANDFFNQNNLSPWAERAAEFGIQASATLPIFKHGQIWAIFAVYHAQKQVFDAPLCATLEQLAQDISYGLQQLEIQQREKNASATQNALLNNTLAGIALIKERIFTQVNARLVELLGYDTADELVGQSTQIMYFDRTEFDKIGQIYPSLIAYSKVAILDVRLKKRDGSLLYVDLSGSLIAGTRYQSTVWTFQDTTQRNQLQRELKQAAAFQHTLFEKNAAAMLILLIRPTNSIKPHSSHAGLGNMF